MKLINFDDIMKKQTPVPHQHEVAMEGTRAVRRAHAELHRDQVLVPKPW